MQLSSVRDVLLDRRRIWVTVGDVIVRVAMRKCVPLVCVWRGNDPRVSRFLYIGPFLINNRALKIRRTIKSILDDRDKLILQKFPSNKRLSLNGQVMQSLVQK